MADPGNGVIDPDELKTVLKASMEESELTLSDDSIEQLALAMYEVADVEKNGEIRFDDMCAALERNPGIMDNLSFG